MQGLTVSAPFLGLISLLIAWLIYGYVKKQPNGTPLMQELSLQTLSSVQPACSSAWLPAAGPLAAALALPELLALPPVLRCRWSSSPWPARSRSAMSQ